MAPLAWIAVQLPALGQAGISGVGIAPAVIALFMYALLPIVRSALAGLEQVPAESVHAARAMGMSSRQLLWQVELPLALPALLIGLRTAFVQTTGLLQNRGSWSQIKMIGITQYNLGMYFMFQLFLGYAFHRSNGTNGHKNRCFDQPMVCG
jgi:ABC-type arginine transport system permease subunit